MTHKWEVSPFKHPLSRAKGLGTGPSVVNPWIMQRMSSLILVPLTFWGIWAIISLGQATHEEFITWIRSFPNAVIMVIFILTSFYHAVHGLQVVIEDYIHNEAFKITALALLRISAFVLVVAAIFSILQLTLR